MKGISAEDDVIDGNEEQFDHIANAAHNGKPDGAWGGDLLELCHIGLFAHLQKPPTLPIEPLNPLHCAFYFLVHQSIISRGCTQTQHFKKAKEDNF